MIMNGGVENYFASGKHRVKNVFLTLWPELLASAPKASLSIPCPPLSIMKPTESTSSEPGLFLDLEVRSFRTDKLIARRFNPGTIDPET